MALEVGVLIVVVAVAGSIWLAYTALTQVRQLRAELDQTQGHLNETRQALEDTRQDLGQARRELDELKAAVHAVPPPPPLPRARSSGLQDLREQLRAAHREETPEESAPEE